MPYYPWSQFTEQEASLSRQAFAKRPATHPNWNDHDVFLPKEVPYLQGRPHPWIVQTAAGMKIQTKGLPNELREAVQHYGAMVEGLIPHADSIITMYAASAVIWDSRTDRLYYGTSGFPKGIVMAIHPTLLAREQQLPPSPTVGIRSLVKSRRAAACSEFKALNAALLDGAREADLHVWTFHAQTMRPFPQCENCRITVLNTALAKVWTG